MRKGQRHQFSCSHSIRKMKNIVIEECCKKAQNKEKTEIVESEHLTKVLEKKR